MFQVITMPRTLIFLLAVMITLAADDPWAKVRDLKSGGEVRIYKKGSMQPVLGKLDEARDESLVVVLKNEQVAIPKDQIDRIDYRAAQSGHRVTKETKTTSDIPKAEPP